MAEISIDLSKVQAEIAAMTPSQVEERLLKIRVRDKVTQKRSYNSDTAKRYQMKARAEKAALKEIALKSPATQPGFANMWEQINAAAEEAAELKLAEEAVVGQED